MQLKRSAEEKNNEFHNLLGTPLCTPFHVSPRKKETDRQQRANFRWACRVPQDNIPRLTMSPTLSSSTRRLPFLSAGLLLATAFAFATALFFSSSTPSTGDGSSSPIRADVSAASRMLLSEDDEGPSGVPLKEVIMAPGGEGGFQIMMRRIKKLFFDAALLLL